MFFIFKLTKKQSESFTGCANSSHCLSLLEQTENLAVAASRQHALVTTSARDVFCFAQSNNIRNQSKALLMRDSRRQTQKWNEMIQRSVETGLIEKWVREHGTNSNIETDSGFRPLRVQDLYGAMLFCAVFLLLAFTAFFLEIIIHNKARSSNPHQFWKTADWIIDGQRKVLKFNRKNHQTPIDAHHSRIIHIRARLPLRSTRR